MSLRERRRKNGELPGFFLCVEKYSCREQLCSDSFTDFGLFLLIKYYMPGHLSVGSLADFNWTFHWCKDIATENVCPGLGMYWVIVYYTCNLSHIIYSAMWKRRFKTSISYKVWIENSSEKLATISTIYGGPNPESLKVTPDSRDWIFETIYVLTLPPKLKFIPQRRWSWHLFLKNTH